KSPPRHGHDPCLPVVVIPCSLCHTYLVYCQPRTWAATRRGFSLSTAGPLRDSQPLGRPASRTRFPHRVLGRPLGRHLRRLATLSPRLFAHEADERLEIV